MDDLLRLRAPRRSHANASLLAQTFGKACASLHVARPLDAIPVVAQKCQWKDRSAATEGLLLCCEREPAKLQADSSNSPPSPNSSGQVAPNRLVCFPCRT